MLVKDNSISNRVTHFPFDRVKRVCAKGDPLETLKHNHARTTSSSNNYVFFNCNKLQLFIFKTS